MTAINIGHSAKISGACTLSALFLFIGALIPDATAENPAPVTFVAYNLKNYLDMDRRIDGEFRRDAPKPDTEIKHIVDYLVKMKPDILGVCEIGDEQDLKDLASKLTAAGLDLPHSTLMGAQDPYRRLALLSKYPITETNHQSDLSYLIDDIDIPFARGILDATVDISKDYQLRLLGIHLKSKRPVPEADEALMRRNEAHLLRKHIDEILEESPDVNLLVYGDFNDNRNEAPIKAVQGRFGSKRYLRDIPLADNLGYRWTYYWNSGDQYSRFDYIFVSSGLYPEVILDESRLFADKDWYDASDHRPLVLKISPAEKAIPGE
ncbi:MAG: endonuclease/exonuclease/phosphatase family protein [Verrucomicrobiota bacterium]